MRWIYALAASAAFAAAAVDTSLATTPGSAGGDESTLNRPLTPDELIEWRIDRAVSHYGQGEFADADRVLGLVIDTPETPGLLKALALFNRGAARLQLDRFSEAILDFDAAESLAFPRPAQLHLARGLAWEHLRILDRAAYEYTEALSADPTNPSVRAKVQAFFYKK
jgi:tetratricopeptide (TPR) repeat protein